MLLYTLLTSRKLLIVFGTAHFSLNMPCSASPTTYTTGLSHSSMATHTVPSSVARCLDFHSISASINQGSTIGPASYVITASNLHLVTFGNVMGKYADDTYPIIPASNSQSCAVEIAQVEKWALEKQLVFKQYKICRDRLCVSTK